MVYPAPTSTIDHNLSISNIFVSAAIFASVGPIHTSMVLSCWRDLLGFDLEEKLEPWVLQQATSECVCFR